VAITGVFLVCFEMHQNIFKVSTVFISKKMPVHQSG
jgi:hypothetical protein